MCTARKALARCAACRTSPHWQKTIKQETLRNWYETHLSLALCLILSLALLVGAACAPLPDGLTQESVTDAAAQTVAQRTT